jgi:hypothetical protein
LPLLSLGLAGRLLALLLPLAPLRGLTLLALILRDGARNDVLREWEYRGS